MISTSHFRSASVSRRIRVFKRLTLPEQIIKLGGLPVTTPARTACDLVMSPEDIPDPSTVNALVCQLMSAYQFRPNDCLQIVKGIGITSTPDAHACFESVAAGDGRTGFGAMRMTRGFIVRGHRRGRHAAHRLRHLRQAQRLPRHAAAAHSSRIRIARNLRI